MNASQPNHPQATTRVPTVKESSLQVKYTNLAPYFKLLALIILTSGGNQCEPYGITAQGQGRADQSLYADPLALFSENGYFQRKTLR